MSRLSLKENIRSSAVCKTWHEAAVSVRDPCPWLVYFDIDLSGVTYGFFDPREKEKTKAMKLTSDLSIYAIISYSKDGWLLMEDYHEDTKVLVFFNPFTQECIKLQSLNAIGAIGTEFAFSCAPTNKSCVVCGISDRTPDHFLIHTWYVGACEWETNSFARPKPLKYYGKKNIIFSDDVFWFPDRGGLGVFDPTARTWNTIHAPLPDLSPFLRWITEHQGNIFLVDVLSNRRGPGQLVVVFKFNPLRLVWERKKTFDGLSIFISDESSIMTYGLKGDINNIVYMWDSHLNSDRPCKYSLYTNSFCTDLEGYCVESSSTNNEMHYGAWIEPPHNSSIYGFPITESK
ncbi:unnamed protein product [Microthlaspi erraticum]|uniref:KIB1-4 beta-propeller domain-containing protein n=1 Tax=Microthlaspi erraticum TaxID=1685480 RepID=A0A6D2HVF5_9BRAS|nr:unnamed protein product [Microthlaspi erraticum]